MIYWKELDQPIRVQLSNLSFNYYQHYDLIPFIEPIHIASENWTSVGPTVLTEWEKEEC